MAGDLAIRRLNWALLIDGENIARGHAAAICRLAARRGALPIRRVCGNAERLAGWSEVPGLRLVHAGQGKNDANLLLCIEAMEIFHAGNAEGIILAASDRDYTHLALHLRERGFRLIVLGAHKTPVALRHAATEFVELKAAKLATPRPVAAAAPLRGSFDLALRAAITALAPNGGWAPIGPLGTVMWQRHQLKRADTGRASWDKYLVGRDDICQTDTPASPRQVRLIA